MEKVEHLFRIASQRSLTPTSREEVSASAAIEAAEMATGHPFLSVDLVDSLNPLGIGGNHWIADGMRRSMSDICIPNGMAHAAIIGSIGKRMHELLVERNFFRLEKRLQQRRFGELMHLMSGGQLGGDLRTECWFPFVVYLGWFIADDREEMRLIEPLIAVMRSMIPLGSHKDDASRLLVLV